jgi:hypothetical protein
MPKEMMAGWVPLCAGSDCSASFRMPYACTTFLAKDPLFACSASNAVSGLVPDCVYKAAAKGLGHMQHINYLHLHISHENMSCRKSPDTCTECNARSAVYLGKSQHPGLLSTLQARVDERIRQGRL